VINGLIDDAAVAAESDGAAWEEGQDACAPQRRRRGAGVWFGLRGRLAGVGEDCVGARRGGQMVCRAAASWISMTTFLGRPNYSQITGET